MTIGWTAQQRQDLMNQDAKMNPSKPSLLDEILEAARELQAVERWTSVAAAGANAGPGNRLADALAAYDGPQPHSSSAEEK